VKLGAKNAMLRIAIHRVGNVERWILYGSLSGNMVDELAVTWKNARRERIGQQCVINLVEVTSVDERGEQVLAEMMREGARFVVRGLYSTSLLERLSQPSKQEA
jgi:ABC-type transporter Mla MlaB component